MNTDTRLRISEATIAQAQAWADKGGHRFIVAEDKDSGHIGMTNADNLFVNVNGHEYNLRVIAVVEPTTEVK